ncbi:flagellar basal body-associated FliL family protein [bacterium]|nr:flagellar basal body-associated FliL family protein [bacterium]MBU1884433.1 flagellar basal body-associated FliL family protein [bacterium]
MNLRKTLLSLIFILSFILVALILVKFALESDFAKLNSKNFHGNDSGYKMKTKYYKELYYATGFKRSTKNNNIVSLGYFNININDNMRHNKLIIEVAIETGEDTIDTIMDRQSVIRNDVIDSVLNIKSSGGITQENVSREIKKKLNKRLNANVVKNVYFEKFIVQ